MIIFPPIATFIKQAEEQIITKMPRYTCGCGCNSFPCIRKKEAKKC